ncbi:MAG: 16S rRNA (adenine(1518)-N(6)/adenine(1519)-N(6))-dimethyltransferase RsmA [Candidatus Pacebacteria bacterium]|nr:16S rRNA (adenine(1518)-N(6)/adenine(1519)-N(6))-dimethyltransferase RsmA [Candidatus Paceibacterota bacterium]
MDLFSKSDIKNILKNHLARPSKGLGQNFLLNRSTIEKLTEALDLQSDELVLEIGPGLGVLTQELARKAKKVVAIEKDRTMIEILKETLAGLNNVEVIEGDALRVDLGSLGVQNEKYKVAGNLPFYLTSPLIRRFLESENPPESMVFTIQKEVGKKICSKPPGMNILAVSVQIYANPKIISYVPGKFFWPEPNVDAAVIKILPFREPLLKEKNRDSFFKIVKAGFSQPRKQLINNLSNKLNLSKEKVGTWLIENKIEPKRRAETLELEDWLNLLKTYRID